MIIFIVDTSCRLLLSSLKAFLVINIFHMFLTSTSLTIDLMITDSDYIGLRS